MFDTADAAADLLAEQRAARLERAGITVEARYLKFARSQRNRWVFDVVQHGRFLTYFDDDDLAYGYAYELANDLTEQGDLS